MRRAQDWLRQAELEHYIGARYPSSHPQGAPGDLYTRRDASQALADAQTVLDHVRSRLS